MILDFNNFKSQSVDEDTILDWLEVLMDNRINGMGGYCGIFAIALNHILGNKGQYVIAANKYCLDKGMFLGHVALLYNGTIYDADGILDEDDLESKGMLDPDDDPTSEHDGFENEDDAFDVVINNYKNQEGEEYIIKSLYSKVDYDSLKKQYLSEFEKVLR